MRWSSGGCARRAPIILGKTNCPEFAAGANTFNEVFGRTRNPWDPSKTAGGSTGGGAAALATGMIALAEGTDLGGSLRIPAAFCGVVGLRPSVGLVPTHPTDWVWDTLQVTGPIARTAEDVGLMLQAIAGPSECSPYAQPVHGRNFVRAATGARTETFGLRTVPISQGSASIRMSSASAAQALLLSRTPVWLLKKSISISPPRGRRSLRCAACGSSRRCSRVSTCRIGSGRMSATTSRSGLEVTTKELAAAENYRGRLFLQFCDLFGKYDHLLTPCVAVPPFPVEQNYPDAIAGRPMKTYIDWIAPTFVLSLTGLPVACVPAGLDSHGMPVGLQIAGQQFGEESVLALAATIQRLRPIGLPSKRKTNSEQR